MTAATPSRLGQVNQANAADALFLKLYGGEVLTRFGEVNVMMGRHMVRTISQGKSAQFPVTGRKSAAYHTPGAELLGIGMNHNERVITIDDLLVSHSFIANIDEAKNHYDVRSIYSMEDGRALAEQMDRHCFQTAVLEARSTTPNFTGGDSGTIIEEAAANDFQDADKLAAALFSAAEALDDNHVPAEDRCAFLRPSAYYTLVQSAKAINRDFGGSGAYSDGTVFRVAGIEIVKTTHLPDANITTGTVAAGTGDKYLGNFTNHFGLVMHKSAIGTVKLMDLAVEMEYDIRRQGTLLVAKYAMGHGGLRPEAIVELQTYTA